MDSLNYNSVETLPGYKARAAFQINSASVFKEDVDILPTPIDDKLSYVPWGGDNQMPFDILRLIEDDETLSTCQMFNAEVCFGSGLCYDTNLASSAVKNAWLAIPLGIGCVQAGMQLRRSVAELLRNACYPATLRKAFRRNATTGGLFLFLGKSLVAC